VANLIETDGRHDLVKAKTARNFLALTQVACAWLWLDQN
jgi:hypothetical protein